jgi:DegV family protein with EDD domain
LQETLYSAEELYSAMRNGVKVSTAQASDFERQQIYQRVLDRHERILYLSVGSVYTGNYAAAVQFKTDNRLDDSFSVIDTTAASGRLGLIVLATARFAEQTDDPQAVIDFSSRIIDHCDEYIFLDRLKYLAAGGRLSKKNAFFGDMLNIKPVVSPKADGARKVGGVRSRRGQVRFALEQLEKALPAESAPLIMLEYSDNKSWVDDVVKPEIVRRYPDVELILQPLSLTSGAHMGPGTWAMAFMAKAD